MDERLKAEFIRLIGCSVTDKKFDFGDFDDFNGLAGLISGQNVFSLVRDKIEDSGAPANFKDYVNRKHLSAVNQQIQQDYYCEVIFGNLEKLGVEYLPFKGGAVRKYYPRPEMRTSCDVDFLVRENDLPKVRETLSSLGFEKQAEANDQSCHDGWEINKTVHVEPHIRLFNETYEGFGDDVWETAVKTSALGRAFSAEKNFVYVALHSFKHFSHGGCGVKSVLDLLILSKAVDPKSPYIADSLKKFGIGKFVGKMLDVARLWVEGAGADDRETVVISDYILDGGAYGSSAASAILGLKGEKKNAGKVKRAYFFSRLFLPYRFMKIRYPFLAKVPVLLPVMWIVRLFSAVLFRRRNVRKNLNTLKVIDGEKVERINAVEQVMKDE